MSSATLEPPGEVSHPVEEAPAREAEKPAPAFLLPRPTNPVMKAFLKGPILAWRLGWGFLIGRSVMIVTTTGRKSGLPRRTAVGFHEVNGHKYVFTLRGPNTDWYRNIAADPYVTIQTAKGDEHVAARRVTADQEIGEAYEFLARMPIMRQWASALGVELSREELIAHKDDFILLTFDPTEEPTPPPLRADLVWVRPALAVSITLTVFLIRRIRSRHPHS